MKARIALTAILIASFTLPALADEYYIVKEPHTKQCQIVTTRPTEKTVTIVGNTVYKTRTEAEGGMKTVKICHDED